jgi:vesicular inhibitory amino acid transporter
MANAEVLNGISGFWRGIATIGVRTGCTVAFVAIAIILPDFDRIMSLLGAVACFTICIILPGLFHLCLFWAELPLWHRAMDLTMVGVASVLALVSTAFNLVPQERLGL